MAHPNEDLARRAWDAFTKRDLDTAAQFFAGDLEYHLGGDTAVSGATRGRDAFFGLTDGIPDIELSFEMHDVLANDEHAVALFRVHHQRPGKAPLDSPGVWVAHMADGKITEVWSFPFDQAAVREFLS